MKRGAVTRVAEDADRLQRGGSGVGGVMENPESGRGSAPQLKNIYFFLFILNNRLFMFSKDDVASCWTFEWTNETSAEHWYSLVHRAVTRQWGAVAQC